MRATLKTAPATAAARTDATSTGRGSSWRFVTVLMSSIFGQSPALVPAIRQSYRVASHRRARGRAPTSSIGA